MTGSNNPVMDRNTYPHLVVRIEWYARCRTHDIL